MQPARQLSHALAITLLFPAAGLAQRQDEGLQLFIEAGIQSREAADALSKVFENLPNVPTELTQALEHFDQLERVHYPIMFRLYTPGGWSYDVSEEPPYFLVVLDSEDELPISQWLEDHGIAERGSGSFVYEEEQRRDGGQRYLLGNRHKEVRQELRRLRGDDLPRPSRAQQQLLAEVSQAEVYAFTDLARSTSRHSLKDLRKAGGNEATMFALGAQRSRGAWTVDIHWSAGSGKGFVGGFLPRHVQACGLDRLLPWKPALALQANPGQGLGRQLTHMNVTRMVPPDARELLEVLLDTWEGPVGFFQPEPKRSYKAPSFAPPTLRLSPEYVVVVAVDRTGGDDLVQILVETMGGAAERTEAGTYALDYKHRSTHFGHRRGIVAVCSTEDPETTARHLEKVLDAAEGRGRARWRMDRDLEGVVQLWLSPAACKRLAETAPNVGPFSPGREWIDRCLTEPSGSGLGASLLPGKHSMRLRLKF